MKDDKWGQASSGEAGSRAAERCQAGSHSNEGGQSTCISHPADYSPGYGQGLHVTWVFSRDPERGVPSSAQRPDSCQVGKLPDRVLPVAATPHFHAGLEQLSR